MTTPNTAKAENEKIALREKAISEVIKPCEVNCTCETCGKFRYVWESGWNAAIEHTRQENARLREALERPDDDLIRCRAFAFFETCTGGDSINVMTRKQVVDWLTLFVKSELRTIAQNALSTKENENE